MFRQRKKNIAKRSRKFVLICALMAIILTVSTYAWFIGMQTVNVTSFDVDIAATDSLLLSLDGETWATEVTMNQDMIQEVSYEDNTNRWSKLVPMSSIGQMDNTASRLILYEKASYTATHGGYRIMASRVDNTGAAEKDGYVAFDLFIKNFSGSQYIEELNFDDEEAIYLTTDSRVKISTDGGGIENTGIENSMRVAFSPIGRVNGATTDKDKIIGIKCDPDPLTPGVVKVSNGVTGICRTDRIWEPNDMAHVENAVKWYQKSCLARTGADVTDEASYSAVAGSCGEIIADGNHYYPTYAVGGEIKSSDNVDVYDGTEYNGYTADISELDAVGKKLLVSYPYFTDTMKKAKGLNRLEFMRLAPNSITKVRIYIFIEGQDIDNYDFSVIGKKVSVAFGFTKERFTPEDIEYNGPPIDITLPVLTLNGDNPLQLAIGAEYVEPGLTVYDNQCDVYKPGGSQESQVNYDACVDDLEGDVKIDSTALNINVAGTYKIIYSLTDKAGNKAIKVRYVVVK